MGQYGAQGPGRGEIVEIDSYCPTIRKYLDSHHSEGQAVIEARTKCVGGLRANIPVLYLTNVNRD